MWSVGRVDLGLDEKEFWNLTMKQFNALIQRKNNINKTENKRADYRIGIISSIVANIYRDKKKKPQPFKPKDFMPKEKQKQTPEQQLQLVEVLNLSFGGKDLRGGVEDK